MNCFQKLLSSWWRTTSRSFSTSSSVLWIAFKIIIFVMKDNEYWLILSDSSVVNCFQKLLSSWWRTTKKIIKLECPTLWIAFKNYYLRDEGQLRIGIANAHLRCELLSKIIIFVMKDNYTTEQGAGSYVVNCFQKLLSSWWRTTTS